MVDRPKHQIPIGYALLVAIACGLAFWSALAIMICK